MKTTLTNLLEKGFFGSLAKVSQGKDRKQMLQQIAGEAIVAIDMAKGLQGRGDWMGAVAKLYDAAGILIQGVDLAETLPGVRMDQLRKQADTTLATLRKMESAVDVSPEESRPKVSGCLNTLSSTAAAVLFFADSLRDSVMAKGSFSEEELLREFNDFVSKMTLNSRPQSEERERVNAMHRYGLSGGKQFGPKVEGQWEPVPDKPGKQRKWVSDHYEYRTSEATASTSSGAAAKSLVEDNGSKIEKPKDEDKTEETTKSFVGGIALIRKIVANYQ